MEEKNLQDEQLISLNLLIADALIRIKALETLLFNKKLILEDEYQNIIKTISDALMISIMQKSNIPGDLNEILDNLRKT